MLLNRLRIFALLEILTWGPAVPWLQQKNTTQLCPHSRACKYFAPSPMLLRGRIFLGARFRLVSSPQIWGCKGCAHEVHTTE